MKVIVAGSRYFKDFKRLIDELLKIQKDVTIDEIVSGGCHGADKYGECWADLFDIPVKIFKADWKKYGKAAGPIRNKEMAEYGDMLVLFWDGKSKGSANMLKTMQSLNKKCIEVIVEIESYTKPRKRRVGMVRVSKENK
jgi:hypothetical protein